MSVMDMVSNGARSLTGAVVKAYIMFEDERINRKDINTTEVRARSAGLSSFLPGADKLMSAVQSVTEKTKKLSDSLGELMSGATAGAFSEKDVYQVKFNPSEMSFQAYGGAKVQKMNFSEGEKVSINFVEMKPRIMLSVPLIFDDFERTDAFMMEKFSDPTALARTAVTSISNTLNQETYSVRPQVEGFVAALRNEKTRKVTFCWANMAYKGFLETVSAEYTMFNMQGNPIRAIVNIGILLVDESIKDGNIGYWTKSYNTAFSEDSSSLGTGVEAVSNLLNLKL